jgi:RNA recognition motif-containing protein
MNIYVGNLPYNAAEEDLRQTFGQYGQVQKVNIIKDKFSGESRGFGFVEMANHDEGMAALQALNGADMGGRKLNVNEARPRTENRGGGGGRDRDRDRDSGGRRNNW